MDAGRRSLLRVLAAVALASTSAAGLGAPARVRRLGVMWDEPGAREVLPRLLRELTALGFVEGRDFAVQLCAVDERNETARECAATLARAGCDVIFTANTRNTRALQRATSTIPIVTTVADPVRSGFAASLGKPGGNITGLANSSSDANSLRKLVALARLVLPRLTGAVLLVGARQEWLHESVRQMQPLVIETGVSCRLVFMDSIKDAEREFRSMLGRGEQLVFAWEIDIDDGVSEAVAQLALRHRVALVSGSSDWVRAGGLLSYSPDFRNTFHRLASHVAMIFRGASPATIPFELPDTAHVVVNRATAAKLGIRIPPEVLILATEVIG